MAKATAISDWQVRRGLLVSTACSPSSLIPPHLSAAEPVGITRMLGMGTTTLPGMAGQGECVHAS